MKILLITNILTPYRIAFYDALFESFDNSGDEFTIFVMEETEPNRCWNYADFSRPYTTLLPGKTLSRGGIFIPINFGVKKAIRSYAPDIIIVSGSYLSPASWVATNLAKKCGIPVLFWSESHDGEARTYGGLKIKIRERLRSIFYSKLDGFWYPGKKARQLIEKYANPKAVYINVPNLIDNRRYAELDGNGFSKFHDSSKATSPENPRVFLCPARLEPAKGILEFLELLNECQNKNFMRLLIAGEGDLREKIELFIKEKRLNVELLGQQAENQMLELYRSVDALVLPSKSDPNPLSCIEACWSGLPLLVSNHVGNAPEVVMPGKNGFVFSFQEREEAIDKIETLIMAGEDWYKNAGTISKEIARKDFDLATAANRISIELKSIA